MRLNTVDYIQSSQLTSDHPYFVMGDETPRYVKSTSDHPNNMYRSAVDKSGSFKSYGEGY